jgi:TatD DNase family protein
MRDFENDLETVINDACSGGIRKILVPGIDVETSFQSIQLCEKFPEKIYAAIGIHPNHSNNIEQADFDSLVSLANHPNVVAIGEFGLDFYRDKASEDDQIYVLNNMLSISKKSGKPVCLHNREADNKIIEILDSWYSDLIKSQSILVEKPGVFHSFSGSEIISEWALTHNFYLGISGPVTFSKSQDLQNKIQKIDISHLIIETDAPYLSPHPYRGKRNEPLNVRLVCKKIAEIKQMDLDEVILITSKNASNLFGWGEI